MPSSCARACTARWRRKAARATRCLLLTSGRTGRPSKRLRPSEGSHSHGTLPTFVRSRQECSEARGPGPSGLVRRRQLRPGGLDGGSRSQLEPRHALLTRCCQPLGEFGVDGTDTCQCNELVRSWAEASGFAVMVGDLSTICLARSRTSVVVAISSRPANKISQAGGRSWEGRR